jgi:hypothetical protein
MISLVAFGTCFSILWPEVAAAQQPPPIERLGDPSLQNDTTLQLDNRRPRRRPAIRDASPPFRPPVTSLPDQRPAQRGWKLAINGQKTDTGILVASVVRGGASDRAGLRSGDRILAIGAERVGIIGNRAVPTREVLRRQVDFQGDVLLLVQRRNSRGLINVSIRLDPPVRR